MSFEESLNQAGKISRNYDVGVVLFSWPSGGSISDYRRAKTSALASTGALDGALEDICAVMYQEPSLRSLSIKDGLNNRDQADLRFW